MPRYYCDYCDSSVTNSSFRARREHNYGFRHREAWREYYSQFLKDPRYDPRMMPPPFHPGMVLPPHASMMPAGMMPHAGPMAPMPPQTGLPMPPAHPPASQPSASSAAPASASASGPPTGMPPAAYAGMAPAGPPGALQGSAPPA